MYVTDRNIIKQVNSTDLLGVKQFIDQSKAVSLAHNEIGRGRPRQGELDRNSNAHKQATTEEQ